MAALERATRVSGPFEAYHMFLIIEGASTTLKNGALYRKRYTRHGPEGIANFLFNLRYQTLVVSVVTCFGIGISKFVFREHVELECSL